MRQTNWAIRAGNKITGTYYGVVYTGTVKAVRPHTQNHDVLVLDVQLDLPISVFGMERYSMIVHASDDPQQLARFQDANDTCVVLV